MNISKPLTWDDLACIYDKSTGGCAKTLEMGQVFTWAELQTDKFFVSEEDTIHKIKNN